MLLPNRVVIASLVALLVQAVAGCSVIPKDGPSGLNVRSQAEVGVADETNVSYALVKLSPTVIRLVQHEVQTPVLFKGSGRSSAAGGDVKVGAGDTISVSIFEAAAGGLFIPGQAGSRPGNFVQLPTQQVGTNGLISVPYAGTIRATGRTPTEIQAEIEDKLRQRAIEPQVVVAVNERRSNEISVLGDVNTPVRFSLEPGGTRLLAALARAGGSRYPAFETIITLQRGRRTDHALLTSIINRPDSNILLSPSDVVFISREQRFYLVFGATPAPGAVGGQQNRRFPFESENLTLAEAVARAGGLQAERADPKSVFIFRLEPKQTLERAGVDVSRFAEPLVPTIYTADLSDAQGFFLANDFYMRHKDVIFVSESPSTDLLKFITIVRGITGAIGDVTAVRN